MIAAIAYWLLIVLIVSAGGAAVGYFAAQGAMP